ncbi:hypothetical protein MXB_3991 [Myxobolus squamalis]|nr:hypothetical protein MXB_3991 [Myxobolus squamalis]
MTTQNIGVVFGPAMITGVTGSDEKLMELSMKSAIVVANIIEQFDKYFPEGSFTRLLAKNHLTIYQCTLKNNICYSESEEENSFQPPYYFTNANAYNYL